MTLWFNWRAVLVLALLACFWGWVLAESVAGPDAPTRGDRATWTESSGRQWCVHVGTTDAGADGRPWAWFTVDADPRRVFHAPVSELRAGCSL